MVESQKAGPSVETIPEGDNRPRLVCPDCGYIAYENPKVVVGAVCSYEERILFCKRAIEPRLGYWTIPAGFLELGESMSAGAAREVAEEACASIRIDDLIGIYEIPRISQIHAFYRAHMTSPDIAPGVESEAVRMFSWADIPWGDLAFPSVRWALEHYREGSGPFFVEAPVDSWPREFQGD